MIVMVVFRIVMYVQFVLCFITCDDDNTVIAYLFSPSTTECMYACRTGELLVAVTGRKL